jgi:hypothetical protein
MNRLKTFRGKEGIEVSLYTLNYNYYITAKGKKPNPRIYRNSTGTVYGIERFPSPKPRKAMALRANNRQDVEYQVEVILKSFEDAAAPLFPLPCLNQKFLVG